MKDGPEQTPPRPRSRRWPRLLAAAAILLALAAGLRFVLFTGADVGCDEAESPDDLALRCSFEVGSAPEEAQID